MLDIVLLNKAISNLYPDVGYTFDDTDLNTLKFANDAIVDESAILAEYNRVKNEFEAKEYQRQRAAEYPSIADQLDTLYHGGYDAWKAQVQAVKNKYPKA